MVTMTDIQHFPVHVVLKDGANQEVEVGGNIVYWTSTDNSVVTVTQDADDKTKADVAAAGHVGTAQVAARITNFVGDTLFNATPLDVTVTLSAPASGEVLPLAAPSNM